MERPYMKAAIKAYFKSMDWILITEVFALSVIGFFIVLSATYHNADISQLWKKQLFWFSISMFGMWLFSKVDYRFWIEASYIFYWIAIVSLLAVFVIGDETNGAKRWIKLGILSYQPSELAKLSILLVLARYIGSKTVELFYLGQAFFPPGHVGYSSHPHPEATGLGVGPSAGAGLLDFDVRGRHPV